MYRRGGHVYVKVGKHYLGTYTSEVKAAEAVSKKLKMKSTSFLRQASRREVEPDAVSRFVLLKQMFTWWKQADLVSLCELRGKEAEFVRALGPLWSYCTEGKETPFRKALVSEWKKLRTEKQVSLGILSDTSAGKTPAARAAGQVVYQALLGAAQQLKGKNREYWSKHVHTNVRHHSGWLPMLVKRARVLRKVRSSRWLEL